MLAAVGTLGTLQPPGRDSAAATPLPWDSVAASSVTMTLQRMKRGGKCDVQRDPS